MGARRGGFRRVNEVCREWEPSCGREQAISANSCALRYRTRKNKYSQTVQSSLLTPAAILIEQDSHLTAVAGGIAPDMAMIVDFSTAQWVELGVMSDLTPYFDAAGLSGDDYWPAAWYLMNYKGKVWQMPFDVDPSFPIFWNKGIFEEVGLDPETGPVTIDDVDAFSQEINRIEDGVATRIGMIPWQTYGFGNSIYTWGWAFGGSFYDEANEEVTPDDEHIVASLQWMVDTAKAVGGPDQVSVTPPGLQVHYFGGGNVGMSPMVSVNFRDVKRYNPDLQIGQGLGCIRDFCISPWDRGRLARTRRS